jgi:hypothetical protein
MLVLLNLEGSVELLELGGKDAAFLIRDSRCLACGLLVFACVFWRAGNDLFLLAMGCARRVRDANVVFGFVSVEIPCHAGIFALVGAGKQHALWLYVSAAGYLNVEAVGVELGAAAINGLGGDRIPVKC